MVLTVFEVLMLKVILVIFTVFVTSFMLVRYIDYMVKIWPTASQFKKWIYMCFLSLSILIIVGVFR